MYYVKGVLSFVSDTNSMLTSSSFHFSPNDQEYISHKSWKERSVKADSHELHLTHGALADGGVSSEIGNFYFSTLHTSAAARLNELLNQTFPAIGVRNNSLCSNGKKISGYSSEAKLLSRAFSKESLSTENSTYRFLNEIKVEQYLHFGDRCLRPVWPDWLSKTLKIQSHCYKIEILRPIHAQAKLLKL